MKKLLTLLLVLLLGVACAAEDGNVLDLAQSRGFNPSAAAGKGGTLRCDYTLESDTAAVMTWTDATRQYTVSGDATALSELYLDALDLGGWESCRYVVGVEAKLSYGIVSARRCETLEEYAQQVKLALGLQALAGGFTGFARNYVLNKRSKKFHYPECPGIRNMNPKNRENFTGTRDELLAKGYSPCGICKP